MIRLFHVSDLHFGAEYQAALDWFAARVAAEQPDAVIVTGDLTMRARHPEFAAAAQWRDRQQRHWQQRGRAGARPQVLTLQRVQHLECIVECIVGTSANSTWRLTASSETSVAKSALQYHCRPLG